MARYVVLLFLLAPAIRAVEPVGKQLLQIRRVYVERLAGDETADQIRDMIIAAIYRSELFVITEDPDRADATLRGSAEDLVFQETHEFRDGVDARTSISLGRSTANRNSRGFSANSSVGEDQTGRTVERRHEAMAAVHLVNKEGDVIWSTAQESRGAKLRGASADVAEKVTRQLLEAYRSLKNGAAGDEVEPPSATATTESRPHGR